MRRRMSLRDLFPMAWLSALALNAGLLLLALSAAHVYAAATRPDVYGYDATPSALSATRRAVEDLARALPPPDADRLTYWNRLVAAELDSGDFSAARGALVASRSMLPARDAARLEAKLPAEPDDAAIAAAAISFLEPDVRVRFDGASLAPAQGSVMIVGAAADLEQRARALVSGQTDTLDVSLLALTLAMGEDADSDFAKGASTLLAARRAGALSPQLAAHYQALAARALPEAALRAAAADAARADGGDGAQGALVEAIRRAVDPRSYAALRTDVAALADILGAASPTGAVRLLALARSTDDVARLRLVAVSSGELGVMVAKRGPQGALIRTAAGTWRLTAKDWLALAGVALAVVICLTATVTGVGQAIRTATAARRRENLGVDGEDLDAVYQIGPEGPRS